MCEMVLELRVGVVVCCIFNADGVVVDAVYVCEECEVWVVWQLRSNDAARRARSVGGLKIKNFKV